MFKFLSWLGNKEQYVKIKIKTFQLEKNTTSTPFLIVDWAGHALKEWCSVYKAFLQVLWHNSVTLTSKLGLSEIWNFTLTVYKSI